MGYFQVRYDSRVVIYKHKMFLRLATGLGDMWLVIFHSMHNNIIDWWPTSEVLFLNYRL